MAVKLQSNYKSAQPIYNTTYTELQKQFMLCQNFRATNPYEAGGEKRYFWFGGTQQDSIFNATLDYNRFYCVADFYITQVHTYSTQIFNFGEDFSLDFRNNTYGTFATCSITTPTVGYSVFDFDGKVNAPIQFNAGETYYMQGSNNQMANSFTLYQLTATAVNGIY
jgi:hypothetical protein